MFDEFCKAVKTYADGPIEVTPITFFSDFRRQEYWVNPAALPVWFSAPELPVAYPGFEFETPDDSPWLEILWIQNGAVERAMQYDHSAVEIGMFRVLVCSRPGQSILIAQAIAIQLKEAIGKGVKLGAAYITRQPEISGPVTDDRNRVIMTTVTWRYQTT